jgi:hypothetical protein
MNCQRWLSITILAIIVLFGLNFLLTYRLDVYGILRDPHGRRLATSGLHIPTTDDRISKYMLNQRYVPSNFDGLLIGSSTTGNWNSDLIHGFRIYNESLAAGNAAEEKALIEQALPTGHFRIALCVLSPYIVGSHALKEGLGQVRPREALGSINSFGEEGAKALAALHLQQNTFFPSGSRELFVAMNLERQLPPAFFETDPQAIADYRSLIQELEAHEVKIVYVVPPLYQPLYDANRAQFEQFLQSMQTELPPAPLIDFTGPAYAVYNRERKNFSDGHHMSPDGAVEISRILDRKLHELLRSS